MTAVHYNDFLWPTRMVPSQEAAPFFLFPIGIFLSLIFALGFFRKTAAIGLWLILRFLVYKNIFYYGLNLDYAGFLLLLSLFAPGGEAFSVEKSNPAWSLPKEVYFGAWLVFTLSMTVSGINKLLISPEWRSGDAIRILFTESAAYYSDFLKSMVVGAPPVFKLATWAILFLEISSIMFLFNRHLRYYYSVFTFILFLFIALFAAMREIGIVVLIFEILLYDGSYLKRKVYENIS